MALRNIYGRGMDLLTNAAHTRWQWPLLLAADAALCGAVIAKVPYTEIDWEAYMQQVSQYLDGERDYTKLYGGTGPLVYPAAHVYIYSWLYRITDKGTNILLAQMLFAGLYLITLTVVMAVYRQARTPPYVFPLLILSKRLHSIFLLRCFNDCFAVFFLFFAIYACQKRFYTLGSIAYTWGVGIKMSLLLALPAIAIVLFLCRGVVGSVRMIWIMLQVQVLIALPFIPTNAFGYLGRAFEFSRQFFFKWTVNWRFVGEEIFLSKGFSISLLAGHVGVLAIFVLTRWLRPAGKTVPEMIQRIFSTFEPFGPEAQRLVEKRITPQFMLTTILTANVIGMLFARSLHYQFYALLAWATPFLLWRSGMHPILQYALWAAQEWAWNVYPSTNLSSQVVVGVLAIQVVSIWWATRNDFIDVPTADKASVEKK